MASLSAKLEEDHLRSVCEREVEELHQLFVAWFQGKRPQEELAGELNNRLESNFSHVAPNGQFLQGRNVLIGHLEDKFGCYRDRVFQIDIYDVQLLWHTNQAGHEQCLCTYEEWQSWQQEEESSEVHQFGRLSTCLLVKRNENDSNGTGSSNSGANGGGSNRYRWVHVHETWLEADAPSHPPRERNGGIDGVVGAPDDEQHDLQDSSVLGDSASIMTGPIQYDKMEEEAAQQRRPEQPVDVQVSEEKPEDDGDDNDDDDTDHTAKSESEEPADSAEVVKEEQQQKTVGAAAAVARGAPDTTCPVVPASATTSPSTPTPADSTGPTSPARSGPTELQTHVIENPDKDILSRLPMGFIVLLSTQVLSREQVSRQEQVASILNSNSNSNSNTNNSAVSVGTNSGIIEYFALDGSLKQEREVRNKLFTLSKAGWGKYPQFFTVYKQGGGDVDVDAAPTVVSYWGDFDNFMASHESGNLKEELYQPHAPTLVQAAAAASGETTVPTSPSTSPTPSSTSPAKQQVLEKQIVAAIVATVSASRSMPHVADGGAYDAQKDEQALQALRKAKQKVLILMSSQSLSRDQKSRQENTKTLLEAFRVPYSELDGARHETRDVRNNLFKKSKLWGVYPQLFIVPVSGNHDDSQASNLEEFMPNEEDALFWGGWDKLFASSDKGTLVQDMAKLAVPGWDKQEVPTSSSNDALVDSSTKVEKEQAEEAAKERGVATIKAAVATATAAAAVGTAVSTDENEKDDNDNAIEQPKSTEIEAASGDDEYDDEDEDQDEEEEEEEYDPTEGILFFEESEHGDENNRDTFDTNHNYEEEEYENAEERAFMEASQGILEFEAEEEEDDGGKGGLKKTPSGVSDEDQLRQVAKAESPIPHDASGKRHVSPKILKYAKPLTWENTLVGISIAGFDIGTSQGPMGDETWYKEVGEGLEMVSQPRATTASAKPSAARKISLPEMVFPTAHVALEGHGYWLSWDVLDAMEDWARAHQEIPVNSDDSYHGVGVLKSKDAALWATKQKSLSPTAAAGTAPVFHYDWTFSTPFAGKVEGGNWIELDESGMRVELLTDKSAPILFFDEIVLFEDDLHDNGQVEYTVKLRVMPSCAYVLARFWLRVDGVLLRLRETRLLIDFFGMKPVVYRDVTWRECAWQDLSGLGLPTDVRDWRLEGRETQAWHNQLARIPEVDPPSDIYKYATLEECMEDPNASLRNIHGDDDE